MNNIYIEGRLVREPNVIYTDGGLCICNFTLAENEYAGKDDQGNAMYEPIFTQCVAFGPEAEKIGNDSQVGRIYKIKGKMIPNNYIDKNTGKKIYKTKFRADFIELGPMPKKNSNAQPKNYKAKKAAA